MSKYFYSQLNIVNTLLRQNPQQALQLHKSILAQNIGEVQTAINEDKKLDLELVQNVVLISKAKEPTHFKQMMLDIVNHSLRLEQPEVTQEVIQTYQFDDEGYVDLLKMFITHPQFVDLLKPHLINLENPNPILSTLLYFKKNVTSITEESVANFSNVYHDFWLKNSEQYYLQQEVDELCKQLQEKFEWLIKKGKKVEAEILKKYLTWFPNEITCSDIFTQNYSQQDELMLLDFLPKQSDYEVKKAINRLNTQYEPQQLEQQRKFFTEQLYVDLNLLKKIEEATQQRIHLQSVLPFYATIPIKADWKTAQIIKNHISRYWKKMKITQKLTVVGQLFRVEQLKQKPLPNGNYQILDSFLIHKIEELILNLRFQDLDQTDRLKVYFLMNCYFSKDLLSNQFNTQYALYIQAYLRNQFLTQPRNQSQLQKSVEESLKRLNVNYEREILVENCFAVDFKIKNTIIEVNGPHHYCTIFGDKAPPGHILQISSQEGIYETLKTSLKSTILKEKGFKVLSIPYFKWQGWSIANKQDQILDDMLKGVSLSDSELLSKI